MVFLLNNGNIFNLKYVYRFNGIKRKGLKRCKYLIYLGNITTSHLTHKTKNEEIYNSNNNCV